MKLTVDTKQDSESEIRKAIQLLNSILEDSGGNYGSPSEEPVKEGIFSIFGETPSNQEPETHQESPSTQTTEKPAPQIEEDDEPKIIPYR